MNQNFVNFYMRKLAVGPAPKKPSSKAPKAPKAPKGSGLKTTLAAISGLALGGGSVYGAAALNDGKLPVPGEKGLIDKIKDGATELWNDYGNVYTLGGAGVGAGAGWGAAKLLGGNRLVRILATLGGGAAGGIGGHYLKKYIDK